MLTCCTLYSRTAYGKPVFLSLGNPFAHGFKIMLHIAVCGLFGYRACCSCLENILRAEKSLGVFMGIGLIFARKIKVYIGSFIAIEAEEGLKGDIVTLTDIIRSAFGAFFRFKVIA